jgi:PAS domain-containing protein
VVQTAAGGLRWRVAGVRADAAVSSGLLEAYARHSPDGLVFTDPQGRILSANRAFATLAQLSAEDQARGEMLDRWLGRTGVELGVLISNLRQRGSVGLFTTTCAGNTARCWKWRSRPRRWARPRRRRWPLPCAMSAAACKRARRPCAHQAGTLGG